LSANRFCKFTYLKGLHRHRFPKGDGAYRVLVTILDYADERGRNAHPGVARLADDCGMGASTIRRHLKWLKERGYIVQESRGHSVGDLKLASVYSLAMPDLPLVTERKVETPTAQLEPPTAHLEQTYRSVRADLPLRGEHLSSPVSDPLSSNPSTSDPLAICWDCDEREIIPGEGKCSVCKALYEAELARLMAKGREEAGQREPVSPSSMPTRIEPEKRWCTAEECDQAPIPGGRYCFRHLHLIAASA
jgi:Helix-turn-helix domain